MAPVWRASAHATTAGLVIRVRRLSALTSVLVTESAIQLAPPASATKASRDTTVLCPRVRWTAGLMVAVEASTVCATKGTRVLPASLLAP